MGLQCATVEAFPVAVLFAEERLVDTMWEFATITLHEKPRCSHRFDVRSLWRIGQFGSI